MTWWDRVVAALRREAADARETIEEAKARLDADLTRREHELNATPEERLRLEQERIAASDAEFEQLKREIAERDPGPPT